MHVHVNGCQSKTNAQCLQLLSRERYSSCHRAVTESIGFLQSQLKDCSILKAMMVYWLHTCLYYFVYALGVFTVPLYL